MATITLNVYKEDNKNEIEKTYTSESYDLMLGTVEDIMQVIDIDKMNNDSEIAKAVMKLYPKLKPFMKEVFPGITDEELNRVKVKELIPTFIKICRQIVEDLDLVKTKPGN